MSKVNGKDINGRALVSSSPKSLRAIVGKLFFDGLE